MKIKMLETFIGSETENKPLGIGLEYEVDASLGTYLVENGKAEAIEEKEEKPKKKTAKAAE